MSKKKKKYKYAKIKFFLGWLFINVSGLKQDFNCWLIVIFFFLFLILMIILNVKRIRHLHETLSVEEFWRLLKLDVHVQ